MTAEEGEYPVAVIQLGVDLPKQRMRHVRRDQRCGEKHIAVNVLDLRDLLPLIVGQLMPEGCLGFIRCLIVLQHQRVADGTSSFQRTGHARLLLHLKDQFGIIRFEIGHGSVLV